MTRTAIVIVTVLLLSQAASAQQLPGVIEQNIKSATSSAGRLAGEPEKGTPQLWIHVRTDAQRREVQRTLAWFKALQVGGRKVDVPPFQVVTAGPQQSQLRYFKPADRAQAQALLAEIRKAVPATVLQDMSSQYLKAAWIEPGHFELWLAPGITRLAVR